MLCSCCGVVWYCLVGDAKAEGDTFMTGTAPGDAGDDTGPQSLVAQALSTLAVHIDVKLGRYVMLTGDEHGTIRVYDIKEVLDRVRAVHAYTGHEYSCAFASHISHHLCIYAALQGYRRVILSMG